MSFDVHLDTHHDQAAFERVSQALAGEAVELVNHSGNVAVGLSVGTKDAVVRRIFRALVSLAKAHGYGLRDPQAGAAVDLDAPPMFPPGWAPQLSLAAVRKMTKHGHYLELLGSVHRIADVNARDANGDSLLSVVLIDAWDKGRTARTSDGRLTARAAEDVALALLKRGADPRQHGPSRSEPILWAVRTDSDRLITAILGELEESARKSLLAQQFGSSGRLLDIARSSMVNARAAEKALLKAGA